MKKILMTMVAVIAICGALNAQGGLNPNGYETHWPFNAGQYELVDYPVAHIAMNGDIITQEGNWADLEIASFVGDEVRGHNFLTDEWIEYGWPNPLVELPVNYNATGEEVSFKVYDHASGVEYDATCNITIHTGEEHTEIYMWDWDNAVVISYTATEPEGIEKEILGHGGEPGGWYLLSSPVGEVNPTAVENMVAEIAADYDLYYFDQSGDDDGKEWINRKTDEETVNDFPMLVGKGYLYANAADVTLRFPGTAYEGTGEFVLDYDGGAELSGWNLVGNPFNADATVDHEFFVMNETRTELMAGTGTVPAMEGAFVKAEEEGETVTFGTGSKVEGSLVAVNLLDSRGVIDRAMVRFGQGRMLPKFQLSRNSTKLYIPVDGEDYAVVRSEGMGEIPVNFKAETSGSYTLAVSGENVSFRYLHLIDNKTGVDVDLLSEPSYSFEASVTDYTSRFKLVFATGESEESFAFYSNGSFVISNEGEATVQVIDVTGRMMSSEAIEGCASIRIDGAAGVYMIRLVNGDNVKVQKVVVK